MTCDFFGLIYDMVSTLDFVKFLESSPRQLLYSNVIDMRDDDFPIDCNAKCGRK